MYTVIVGLNIFCGMASLLCNIQSENVL